MTSRVPVAELWCMRCPVAQNVQLFSDQSLVLGVDGLEHSR